MKERKPRLTRSIQFKVFFEDLRDKKQKIDWHNNPSIQYGTIKVRALLSISITIVLLTIIIIAFKLLI